MSQKIFRESALTKLSTPEQLDKIIQVTDRKGWIALTALIIVVVTAVLWSIFGTIPTVMRGTGLLVRQDGIQEVRTEAAGQITQISIKAGDTLKPGQAIGKIKNSQGTETDLQSPENAMVLEVLVEKGMLLQPQALVARLELTSHPLQAVAFVPLSDGKRLRPGLQVQVSPSTVRAEEAGYLLGTVSAVSQFPVSSQSLLLQLKSQELVDALASSGPLTQVDIKLETSPSTYSGFKWSSQNGPHTMLTSGTLAGASLILDEQHPISLILPILRNEN